ncbi:MAG TPA: extracellular solute-binding protein [Nocardiopsis listeri]|uniref:ABC transporter substrate-binding protein n=1 Tax=Nocardiopsis listeri TaxID=53440 RepID=UPI001D63A8EA|nr:extracellular solute-binding protein [Nocardiopsis listeri]HJE61830.1 extracellular solute-binding protein [Nocardiopsis listeri]
MVGPKKMGSVAALALALAVGTTSCGINAPGQGGGTEGDEAVTGDFDALVEAAQEEGTLTVYSTETEEHLVAVINAFEEEYGIPVEYVRLASSAVVQRFAGEKDSGVVAADVIQLTDTTMVQDNEDWFRPFDEELLPALAEYDEEYRHDHHAAGAIYASGVQYNTDLVSPEEVPESWEDLLDPKWEGQILMVDPQASPTPVALLELLRETYGDDFLERLGEQNPEVVDSAGPGGQQVAAGAFAFNFPTAGGAHTQPLIDEGAPVDFTLMSPATLGTNEVVLPEGSPNPNAGALFANFRLSLEGHKAVCDTNPGYGLPFEEVLDGCIETPEDTVQIDFDLWADEELKRDQLDELGL